MKLIFNITIPLLITLSFINTLFVYSQDSIPELPINEVVISSIRYNKLLQKTPDVILVITNADIKKLNATNTSEILEYVTGMSIGLGTGSASPKRATVNMNGYPANYGLILVDGKRLLSDHIQTGQNIDLIPPENIERIEIIKGSASSQYGSDAMAGIINIITKTAGEKSELSIFSSYGNFNEITGGIAIRTPIVNNIKASTFVNWEQSDGIEIKAPVNRAGYMDYKKYSLMNTISKKFNDSSEFIFQTSLINGSNTWKLADVYNRMFIPSIEYNTKITPYLTFSPKVYYSMWTAQANDEKNELTQPEMLFLFNKIKNNLITFGGEYKYINFKRTSIRETSQQAMGYFLQDEISIKNLVIFPALRYDKYENINGVFSPKLSLLYNISTNYKLRASVGKGFHAPTIMDLYEKGYGHSGRAYRFGNPLLKPEYNLSSTIGFESIFFNKISLIVYGYYSKIENMITPIYQGPWSENPKVDMWIRTNIYEAEIYGGESFIKYQITNNINWNGGITITKNRNLVTNKQLPYYPGKSLFTRLHLNKNISSKFNCNFFISYKTEMDRSAWSWKPSVGAANNDPNGFITSLKQYHLLNTGINVSFDKKYNLFFNVNNILKQNIESLDDAYYVLKGRIVYKVGFVLNF